MVYHRLYWTYQAFFFASTKTNKCVYVKLLKVPKSGHEPLANGERTGGLVGERTGELVAGRTAERTGEHSIHSVDDHDVPLKSKTPKNYDS